jgi:hypothetical protein
MLTTDFNELFLTITESIPNYLMALALILFLYLLLVELIKLLTTSTIQIIAAIRAPLVGFSVKTDDNEKK